MTITTTFVNPPIGTRSFDWVAVLAGFEGEGGKYEASGETEQEAIDNLKEQLEVA